MTYTSDGQVASIGLGQHLLADDDDDGSTEIDLPDDFPSLTGPDAEREVSRAVARLRRTP
ncbi:hypothetical protein [Cellulomonas cellasea]|uniref:Uncharacterized protein n=1 Tax=Cellulomonas cellasea TaxID=43670 RepID=A0A7W4UBV0_9CELL|nr:hypothetical protein [Cellulomonas cellasea]MBB2921346.1 hypothetical protein [Cellulomonas cellasea]